VCSFCSLNSFYKQHPGPKIRLREVSDILDEIEYLYHSFGARFFRFADDTFFTRSDVNRKRAIQIANGIVARGLKVKFAIQLRADAVDPTVLLKLKEAGLVLVMIGVEALDKETLTLYKKKTSAEDNYRAAQMLSGLNIRFRACYITFNPLTTIEHLRSSIKFFRSLTGPHQCDHIFNRLYVLHGTPIEQVLNDAGMLKIAGYHYDYDFQDPKVDMVWRCCERYLPIFTPVKREIGALWEWWFQHSGEANLRFEMALEQYEHALTDHHLYFLENLVDWADEKKQVEIDPLLDEMRKRVDGINQGLVKIKEREAEHGIAIWLYSNYVFDANDLTYGLQDDLRGKARSFP